MPCAVPDFTSRLEGDMELVWRLVTEVGNDGNTEGRARALTLWIWVSCGMLLFTSPMLLACTVCIDELRL